MANDGFIYLKDYKPTAFRIDHVSLEFDLDPSATRVKSTVRFSPREGVKPEADLKLDGENLKLISIAVDGSSLHESQYALLDDGLLLKNLGSAPFTLETEVEINPEGNKSLMGLFRTGGNYSTQCEADGFRKITYFLDRPDVLTTYGVKIIGDKETEPYLLSNGNLMETGDTGEGRHYAIWQDPHPKPAYLFALVAGAFDRLEDSFTTRSGREVALHLYVEEGKKARGEYAVGAIKRSMKWDEDVFGCEYDLDIFQIVAVPHFNMGAMENKGLNIFNDKFILADQDTATDADYSHIEAIIAHEYFHNWTGNRITCRDWFQLCLKEGLTVFRDQEFTSDLRDREVKRIEDVRGLRAHQFSEDAGPLAHPVRPEKYKEINNFYTATVYEKGAEIVRMLKTILGDEGFRKGMDLYLSRHDGDAATIEDFLKCFADANERDLSQFALWYSQAGTPVVKVETRNDNNGKLIIRFAQELPITPDGHEKEPQVIPIRYGVFNRNGEEATSGLFVLDTFEKTLEIEKGPQNPVLSLLRGFSAPVRLETTQGVEEDMFLLKHDNDGFNRWQASQSLALHFIRARLENARAQGEEDYAKTLGMLINDTSLSHAFRAHLLALPTEQDVARELSGNVNPQAIRDAREGFVSDFASRITTNLAKALEETKKPLPFEPDAKGGGYRAFKLAAMSLIAKADKGRHDEIVSLFENADNMTERFGAMAILVREKADGREHFLASFEKRYQDNPIVMDKWFALQATLAEAETLERVKRLMSHPVFSLENPNRVRALIGTFAMANPTRFHAADGSGYAFLCNKLSEIDPFNPQLAARLANSFGTWARLEPTRKAAAQGALENLRSKTLSRDLSDMLERTLAAAKK